RPRTATMGTRAPPTAATRLPAACTPATRERPAGGPAATPCTARRAAAVAAPASRSCAAPPGSTASPGRGRPVARRGLSGQAAGAPARGVGGGRRHRRGREAVAARPSEELGQRGGLRGELVRVADDVVEERALAAHDRLVPADHGGGDVLDELR